MIPTKKVHIHPPFLKFGKKEHMEKLIYEGEVYFNTIDTIKKFDNEEIGDRLEGLSFISHLPNCKIQCNEKNLGEAQNIVMKQENYINRNLFCLFALENQYVIDNLDKNLLLSINVSKYSKFGTHCVVIGDIPEFRQRLLKKIKEKELKVEHQLVRYLDFSKYNGEVTPFMKDIKYSHQCEYRFLVHNTKDAPVKFSIGNIEDIAHIIPISSELVVGFEKYITS